MKIFDYRAVARCRLPVAFCQWLVGCCVRVCLPSSHPLPSRLHNPPLICSSCLWFWQLFIPFIRQTHVREKPNCPSREFESQIWPLIKQHYVGNQSIQSKPIQLKSLATECNHHHHHRRKNYISRWVCKEINHNKTLFTIFLNIVLISIQRNNLLKYFNYLTLLFILVMTINNNWHWMEWLVSLKPLLRIIEVFVVF